MEDRYEYIDIDEETKKFAMKNLFENPVQVNAHIESFRRWVKSMPHLKCPTDSKFLLRFLRVAKFDHEKAQKRLDNFCTIRTSVRGLPNYFKPYDIDDPKVETFLKMKIFNFFGRTEDGELFVLIRPNDWNPDTYDAMDVLNLFIKCVDILLYEEAIQINGVSYVMDLSCTPLKAIEQVGSPKVVRSLAIILQDSYPIRSRSQIYFKEPLVFEIIIKIMKFFMNKKNGSRIYRIGDDMNKLLKLKPGLLKLLPSEYNGLAGTLDECIERWNARFREFYQNRNSFQDIAVDESKRPKANLTYLQEYPDFKGQGTSGIYTKFQDVL